jgi:hypothetical protein
MRLNHLHTRIIGYGVALFSAAALMLAARPAHAQSQPGECSGGNCGTPNNNGGGCGCGCGGSILVNYTDIGQSYEQSDDSDHDGIDDALDNCPYVANPDQVDVDGDGLGNVCDNCVSTPNANQKTNTCGDIWATHTVEFKTATATNNVGMVIGAACDVSCDVTTAPSKPTTVSVAPPEGTGHANADTSGSGGSKSSSGEVACSVRNVGDGTTSGALLVTMLGMTVVGLERRRRARRDRS